MGELRRSYSLTLVPQFERPKILVTSRTSASHDLTKHIRRSDKYARLLFLLFLTPPPSFLLNRSIFILLLFRYKPQWSGSNYFRDPRDFAPYDDNWYVRNRVILFLLFNAVNTYTRDTLQYLNPKHWPNGYLTPLYWPRDNVKHLDYYSEGVPNPFYPNGYHRNYFDNTYDRYLNDPYYVQDSENRAVARGLQMYRNGLINYSSLDRYWLTPGYWDRRHRNWRDLYAWEHDRAYLPHKFEKHTQSYFPY